MLKKVIISISFLLFTMQIFAQKKIVTPKPPINYTGAGVTTTYSSEDGYITLGNGKVIIQFWVTKFEGPEFNWIIKQARLVITPPKNSDIEDMTLWLQQPDSLCELMDWQPKINGKGITIAAAVNVDLTPGLNIGTEFTIGVDEVQIEAAPGSHYYLNHPGGFKEEGVWFIDWDDFSDAAASKSKLDFYAMWRCPKKCKCPFGNQDAKSTTILIEFDEPWVDIPLILKDGKIKARSVYMREKVKKTASVWTPPTGETRIAVVGTVQDEKVMMTSRGGSIGGTVTLETEEGEELAVVEPDEEGHFAIDFSDIAALTVASTLVLTQLDSEGNAETSTTLEYVPGTPPKWIGPPIVKEPEVSYMENNQLYDIEGSNLGKRAEVIIIDEQGETILQETVSSSMNLTQFYLDAPIGSSEILVRNDFGNSEPLETGIYEFDVRAGKMNLIKNENTNITANYDGLPKGTKIIFTNLSENVTISPNGNGKALGNEITFIVEKPTGEVSMTLTARKAGGWMLNYRLEFPVSN